MPRVLVAMSGGVDSSVAAYLLQKEGFECVGCTMQLHHDKRQDISEAFASCSLNDAEDAKRVARHLGIPHLVCNLSQDFKKKVIDRFAAHYEMGLTPNPCIDCNKHIKFGKLFGLAKFLGCDYIATGHFARIDRVDGRFVLKKALDPSKDQSYALYNLTQEQLSCTLFPLGNLTKAEVRRIAEENGFINADKSDSQDICFVPDGDYAKFVQDYSGRKAIPGDFVDSNGQVLGRHKGIIHYTIGQRRGLGVSSSEPVYVIDICPENNTVILGKIECLYSKDLTVDEFNWTNGTPEARGFPCKAKIRCRQAEQPATVFVEDGHVRLVFDEAQRAITPGQSAVLYDGDIVLGGGVISRKERV